MSKCDICEEDVSSYIFCDECKMVVCNSCIMAHLATFHDGFEMRTD